MEHPIPPFLTVEEASRILKIGRTKAYDLTKEWRATGGRSGLPVVDLGDVLRVPGPAIEKMLGTGLATAAPLNEQRRARRTGKAPDASPPAALKPTADDPPAEPAEAEADVRQDVPPVPATRTRRQRRRPPDQLPLFQPLPTTNPNPHTPLPRDPEPTSHP